MRALVFLSLLIALPLTAADYNEWQLQALSSSITDLQQKYPDDYKGQDYLARLKALQKAGTSSANFQAKLRRLKRDALLAHPLLAGQSIVAIKVTMVKRLTKNDSNSMAAIGLPETHLSLSNYLNAGAAGSIVKLSSLGMKEKSIVPARPKTLIADLDLHWDTKRLLFARPHENSWKIFEIGTDGSGLRQVSKNENDVNVYDPCYLPNGQIIFASDAPVQGVPCWHGIEKKVANLYVMNADGGGVRRLCYDQDHDMQPSVLNDGRVVFNRWDYTGMNRLFNRQLIAMHPDGSGQKALFGSNTWYPNSIYSPKAIPGSKKIVGIIGGYHRSSRCGYLAVLNPSRGNGGKKMIETVVTGRPGKHKEVIMDRLTENVFPKFSHAFPIDEQYALVSVRLRKETMNFSICLADVHGNVTMIKTDPRHSYLKPALLRERPVPQVLPERVDLSKDSASVYIQNVYTGPGLDGVPAGTITKLRVISYDFGYPTLAGVDKVGMSGPWDVMRVIGEANVHKDGSALFQVPADTPIAFQLLDDHGQALQLMRSWVTAMPGERMSCLGCHEDSQEAPVPLVSMALRNAPQQLQDCFGPPRGFDFGREIQPLLNRNCVSCHDEKQAPDLRPKAERKNYVGREPSYLDHTRLNDAYKVPFNGKTIIPYTPAYEALVPYLRRVNVGDDVSMLTPGEYAANTSPLIQMLQKEHHGVGLTTDDMRRLYLWIDLNGPCHGRWEDVFDRAPLGNVYDLRKKYRSLYGSKQKNMDEIHKQRYDDSPKAVSPPKPHPQLTGKGRKQKTISVDVGRIPFPGGLDIPLRRIPAGSFMMGAGNSLRDEGPMTPITIGKGFLMSSTEISNAQFRLFRPGHDSRYYGRRHLQRSDDQGVTLNADEQPALRVSWDDAQAFCAWLSKKIGKAVRLPTEAQWEYACRAGSEQDFFFGSLQEDFAVYANMADRSFADKGITGKSKGRELFVVGGDAEMLISEGRQFAERRFDDGKVVTASVSSYSPNAFGLHNMHGNVAEWTRSVYRPYPYREADGRNDPGAEGERVVRGGSCYDAPRRCRAAFRLGYPSWQRVHNTGFRIVIEDE